jgi:hypothetical protein
MGSVYWLLGGVTEFNYLGNQQAERPSTPDSAGSNTCSANTPVGTSPVCVTPLGGAGCGAPTVGINAADTGIESAQVKAIVMTTRFHGVSPLRFCRWMK